MSENALRLPHAYSYACTLWTAPTALSIRVASFCLLLFSIRAWLDVMIYRHNLLRCTRTSLPLTLVLHEAARSGNSTTVVVYQFYCPWWHIDEVVWLLKRWLWVNNYLNLRWFMASLTTHAQRMIRIGMCCPLCNFSYLWLTGHRVPRHKMRLDEGKPTAIGLSLP